MIVDTHVPVGEKWPILIQITPQVSRSASYTALE